MRVLLVEDDQITQRFLVRIVESRGHTVDSFSDAEKAWEAYQKGFYPLLLLDWMLPGMSGLDLCRNVRNSPQGPFSIVLVVTAMNEAEHLEAVLEAGADDYIAKPIAQKLMNVRLAVAERRVDNILQHKEAEEQRRLLATAVRSSGEGMFITTAENEEESPRIVYVNESMATMTGYTRDELLHQPIEIFEGPETNRDVLAEMGGELVRGEAFFAEILLYKKDHSRILVRWQISPVRDDTDRITHYVSVLRDITETRRLERELVEISEREQRRIGRDLHDGLGQQLTGLAFMARSLERKLQDIDEDAARAAMTIAELVNDTKSQARILARGLVTVDLAGTGIVRALEDLAANTEQMSAIPCTADCHIDTPLWDETVATHLYRICQEAVNNAIKHSGATHVNIELNQDGHQLLLAVRDNGAGIASTTPVDGGMGLRIMEFRAQMINATLNIRPRVQGGTLVLCSLVYPGVLAHTKEVLTS
ncbi:MAG: response regulator [Rhodothermales bacterium]|nr:response regulator [Rhodothermales bacterium]